MTRFKLAAAQAHPGAAIGTGPKDFGAAQHLQFVVASMTSRLKRGLGPHDTGPLLQEVAEELGLQCSRLSKAVGTLHRVPDVVASAVGALKVPDGWLLKCAKSIARCWRDGVKTMLGVLSSSDTKDRWMAR